MTNNVKKCTKCDETKTLSEFGKEVRNRGGLKNICRECVSVNRAAWRAANKDKENARTAAWRVANPEKDRARYAKYRAANREKRIAQSIAWRSANKDRVKAYQAEYKAENSLYFRVYENNRRARKISAGVLSNNIYEKLLKLQRGKCACGCKQPLGADCHLDHRMPLALGGPNTDDNMQLLRKTCNLQKHAKHPVDFMQQRGFLL